MSCRLARTVLSAVCLLLPAAAVAADLVPVEDFARHAQLSMPRLSPDGKHLAVNMNDTNGDSHALAVYDVADMSRPVSLLRLPKYELAVGITWVSNTRLVVEKGKQLGSIDKPAATGEVIATDFDGKNQDYLYGFESKFGSRAGTRGTDRGWGFMAGLPAPTDGRFYMTTYSWESQDYSTLYDVDAGKNTRRLIGQIKVGGLNFMVGADGKAHYAYGRNDNWDYVVYHQQAGSWMQMAAAQIGGSFTPIFFTPDRQRVYASYNAGGGPTALVEQDENGGNRKVLASDSFSSIGDIEWTALPYQPFATVLATGLPQTSYIDATTPTAKLHRALSQKFAGHVQFVDFSEDGSKLMFWVSSDRDPGTYYLIDTHNYKVSKLFTAEPWIDPAKMAERRPLRFKASDGMELEAILTIPKGVAESHLPMVLLPHGGPIGVQDTWYYDTDAQFLASRGYLVLQVNYRGSGGRGEDFKEAGYLKWGTRIQQDLIDGVKWAIAENYADPKRVCVYGGSFGGYSAMMTTIRAPGMFKCAVGYAGIYDLKMMYKKGDIRENKSGRSYLNTVIGKDDADLDANSPTRLADKIDVPVLLIHGEDDKRAPFAQAKAMRAALDAAHKPYEWLSKPGEGHGFYDEKNNIEFYNRLQAFLEKNIGPGASAP
ncbi:prolyl oligopeptidase [Rhodanobacter sp. Soil772]|uniref:alpha/beta hydrolase family protein n=1 Tax=Rhodanobacter sp. Soil772 TaxID=1736406 RepID=UPI0006FE8765|nr:S9 family peptidase [Rhodanobacter sp. Soil772]KRE85355.1 prolyl oligopeptidase [Rhodanobacter sp. Soil772]